MTTVQQSGDGPERSSTDRQLADRPPMDELSLAVLAEVARSQLKLPGYAGIAVGLLNMLLGSTSEASRETAILGGVLFCAGVLAIADPLEKGVALVGIAFAVIFGLRFVGVLLVIVQYLSADAYQQRFMTPHFSLVAVI